MGCLRSFVVLVTGVAIGGALILAHRVSQETGKSLTESFAEVPGEAQRVLEDLRARVDEAVNRGREAYGQKQVEMDAYLSGGGTSE
jgi:uncharacterized protein YkwD